MKLLFALSCIFIGVAVVALISVMLEELANWLLGVKGNYND